MGSTLSKTSSEPILTSVVIYARDSETPIIIPQLEPKSRHQASQTSGVPFQTKFVQTEANEYQREAITQTEQTQLTETSIQTSVDTSTISIQTEQQGQQDSASQTDIRSVRSKSYTESTSEKFITFTIKKIRFRKEEGTPHDARVKQPIPDHEAVVKEQTKTPGVSNNLNQPKEGISEILKHIKNIRKIVQAGLEMLNDNGDSDQHSPSSLIEQFVSSPKVQMKQQKDSITENKPNDIIVESKQELQHEPATQKRNKHGASPSKPEDLPLEKIATPTSMHATTEEKTDQQIMSSSSIDVQDLVPNENMSKENQSPSISPNPKENVTQKKETIESSAAVQDLVAKDQPIILTACLKTPTRNSEESSKERSPSADPQEGASTAQLYPEESSKQTKEKKRSAWKQMKRALARPLRRFQNHASSIFSFPTPACLKGSTSTSRELLPSADPKEGSSNGQLSQLIAPTECLKSPSEPASGDSQEILEKDEGANAFLTL